MLDRYGVMKVMYYTVCHGVSGSNRYCSEFLLLKICVREKMAYSSQVEFLKFEVDPIRSHEIMHFCHLLCTRVVVGNVLELGEDILKCLGVARRLAGI